ncbi:MAG: lactonase family protein [Muribaculaceae bacterium]|nr:lactonase family protein [Muribaculaceae bacterium]MDE6643770.1 lactonase family protein [Muribaculaceae bacterium]
MSLIQLTVGSYNSPDNQPTIHRFKLDTETGSSTMIDSFVGLSNPSFIAFPQKGVLLAVNEDCNPDDGLTVLHLKDNVYHKIMKSSGEGSAPCHVAVSPDCSFVATANYLGGSVSIFPFDKESGTIGRPKVIQFSGKGSDERRQAGPHAHFVTFTPDGRYMIVPDLGTDALHIIPMKDGKPDGANKTDLKMSPGSGPRHIVFNQKGDIAYLVSELAGTVTIIDYDSEKGTFTTRRVVELDPNHAHASADIHLSSDGRFLYASNRRIDDGLVCYAVDLESGELNRVGFTPTGSHPRNFTITTDGKLQFVACRDDNRIEVYRRNLESGALSLLSTIACPLPVCILLEDSETV